MLLFISLIIFSPSNSFSKETYYKKTTSKALVIFSLFMNLSITSSDFNCFIETPILKDVSSFMAVRICFKGQKLVIITVWSDR